MKKMLSMPLAAVIALGVLGACDTGTDTEVETGTVETTPATTDGDLDMATQTPAADTGTEPGAVADDSVTNQETSDDNAAAQQNTSPDVEVSTTQPL